MVELADTQDLGSCAERCGGSSPPSRTKQTRVSAFIPAVQKTQPAEYSRLSNCALSVGAVPCSTEVITGESHVPILDVIYVGEAVDTAVHRLLACCPRCLVYWSPTGRVHAKPKRRRRFNFDRAPALLRIYRNGILCLLC